MLKTMRNSFHQLKWTLFAVIAVFILGFVFWSGSGNSAGTGAVSGPPPGPPISPTLKRAKRRIEIFSPSLAIACVIISPMVTLSSLM